MKSDVMREKRWRKSKNIIETQPQLHRAHTPYHWEENNATLSKPSLNEAFDSQ